MAIFNWKPKLVLPTVYDDALSYQEVLGKVIDALSQMGETGKLANVASPLENPVLQITEKGVVLTGKANIVYEDGSNTDTDIEITYPIAAGDNIIFDVEGGKLVITGTGTNYGAGEGIKITGTIIGCDFTKVQAKLTAGEGIAIENEVIKTTGNGKEVAVSLPEGGTSGTLDETQFNTLIASDNNWVTVNNERYILMDKEHTPGIRVYTHDGLSGLGTVKYLSLTVNTRAFTIVEDYLTPRVIVEGTEGTIDEDKRELVNRSNCVIILTPDLPIKYFRFIGKDSTNLVYACQYNQTLTRMVINSTTYAWTLVDTVFENAVNKVTNLSASSTNAQYPSAKATYDSIQAVKTTADTAKNTADTAKTKADAAKALAETNEITISEVQETIPTFQLSGATLTINMPN